MWSSAITKMHIKYFTFDFFFVGFFFKYASEGFKLFMYQIQYKYTLGEKLSDYFAN